MYPLDDTIAAIASPPGGAARGIVRISGPRACRCLGQFFQPAELLDHCGSSRFPRVIVGTLRLPDLHGPLPCDAYAWPDGRSYTGQPVVEIHTLGSPPVLQLVLRTLCAAGARLAGPGEFTLRAFLAGRIDLTQAEAVLGVINADDANELNIALRQLAGGLAHPLSRLRDALLDLLAHLEAGFDFADEPLAFITREELERQLAEACGRLAKLRGQVASRGEAADAVRAVLIGRPNTGKSSLLNALAGDLAALVSDHPGTTRDYLTADVELDGVKCRLVDTAGTSGEAEGAEDDGAAARRASGQLPVEQAAQAVAAEQCRAAHVQVLCLDATRPLDAWERGEVARTAEGRRIIVLTKCDAPRETDCPLAVLETSSITGQGMAELRGALRQQVLALTESRGDVVVGTALRSADSLRLADQCLGAARQVAAAGAQELAATEIRLALEELGKVAGAVYTDDVLERIFSRFCIGK
jgi:tRNA modification GTPase